MPLQNINIGTTANDGTGDDARTWAAKSNANFSYLESLINSVIASTKETFTATASQTVFTLSTTPSNVDVWVDGQYQLLTTDYTLLNDEVTLTQGAYAGSIVTIRKFKS